MQIIQNDGNYEKFCAMKGQFLQSLLGNFEQRFPASEFLQAAACLNPVMRPQETLRMALFFIHLLTPSYFWTIQTLVTMES